MFNTGYLYAILAVLLNVLGQVGFKYISVLLKGREIQDIFNLQFCLVVFFVGLSYLLAIVLWVIALTKVPLSKSYSLFALSFLLVPLIGIYLFGEDLSVWRVSLAFVFILIGILIVNIA